MPTLTHEALLELFRNRPTLAAEVLRGVLPELTPSCRVEIADSNLTASVPVERTADLVLLFDTPRLAVIVEVQLAIDVGKPRAWFWYLASIGARHASAACLVVVCPNRRVARWASQPLATGHPGLTFVPLVIGPSQIPVIRDAEAAKSNPSSPSCRPSSTDAPARRRRSLAPSSPPSRRSTTHAASFTLMSSRSRSRLRLANYWRSSWQTATTSTRATSRSATSERGRPKGRRKGKREVARKGKREAGLRTSSAFSS